MMLLGARSAAVLGVFGLAINSLVGVAAFPLLGSDTARVVTSCTRDKLAALTFDDGPADNTRKAMELLEAKGAKGTFFVNGKNWGCIYDKADILKETFDRGHQVASHTWSHPHLNSLTYAEVERELSSSHDAIKRITGADVAFMRPPYGEHNDNVSKVAARLGETIVNWNVDSGDALGHTIQQQKDEFTQAVNKNMRSIISLQHDVHPTSVYDVLPHAIKTLQDAGYTLVTIAECIGEAPYHSVGQPQQRNSDWHC